MEKKPNLAQRRAKHAWNVIERVKKDFSSKEDQLDFRRQVKRMPIGIMTSGLGHTIAFMHANESNVRKLITTVLSHWLLNQMGYGDKNSETTGRKIEEAIQNNDSDFLREITEESLLYLQWLTRFADAEFKKLEGNKDGNGSSNQSG